MILSQISKSVFAIIRMLEENGTGKSQNPW